MTARTRTFRWRGSVAVALLGCSTALSATALTVAAPPASADALGDKKAQAAQIAARLDALGERVSVLAEQLDNARLKAADLATQVAQAQKDVARAEADAAGARSALAGEAVNTYVTGGLVPTGASPSGDADALRASQYAETLQGQRADTLDAARAKAGAVRDAQARLQRASSAAAAALSATEKAQHDAQAASDQLTSQQAQVQGELADLVAQAEAQRAAEEAAKAQARLAAQQAAADRAARATPAPGAAPAAGGRAPSPAPRAPRQGGGGTQPAPDAGHEAPAPSSGASAAIAEARRQIGKPYSYGAAGPNSFDCSGLTMWAWRAGGRSLPHSSQSQYASLPHVNPSSAQPGDLFFFGSPIHHVGLYIGGGQMIEAPHSGTTVRYASAYRSDLVGVARP